MNEKLDLLIKERDELIRQIAEAESGKNKDFGSDVDGFDEEADEAEEKGTAIAISEALRKRLVEVEVEITKIESN